MIRFLLVTIVLIWSVDISAQNKKQKEKLEALEATLSKEKDISKQVDLLIKISATYTQFDQKLAIENAVKSIKLVRENNLKNRLAGVYNNIAFCYGASGNPDKAVEYYYECLKHTQYAIDSTAKGQAFRGLGMLSAEMGDFPKALEYAFSSIKEFERMNRKESMCYSYGFISNIYSNLGNMDEAEKYLKKSISMAEELSLKIPLCDMSANLSEIYMKKNQHQLAKESIDKSIQISQEIGNNRGLMNGYQVLGSIYTHANVLDSALYYYKLSLDLNKTIGDQQSEANVSLKAGEVYRIKKDFNNAKIYFLKAESIAKNNKYTNLIIDTNKGLYEVSKNIGSPKEAYGYIEDHIALKDSVYNKENDEKIAEQKVQYEYDKKAAIDKLVYDQNIAQQKSFQKYLAFGLLLLSGLLFFAFRAYRIKKKAAETISNQKDEIEKYSQINENLIFSLSHDIKEPMLGVQLLLNKIKSEDAYLQKAATSIGEQVGSINSIVNNLLQLKKASSSNDTEISSPSEIKETVAKVTQALSYRISERSIQIINQLSDSDTLKLSISNKKLYLVAFNLLSNAIKHSPKGAKIEIYTTKDGLFIRDYGDGIDPAILDKIGKEHIDKKDDGNGSGMGLMLISNLIAGSGLKLHFENANGRGTLAGLKII